MKDLDPVTNTEYSGPPGFEKRIHQDRFTIAKDPFWKDGGYDTGFEWVKVGMRWKLVKKNESGGK